MGTIFVIVCVVALALVLAWNFVPGFRDKVQGWSTVLEGTFAAVIYVFGQVSDGLQEAVKAGYVPDWLVKWTPIIFCVWIIVKRFQTKTPVGVKK